MKNSTKSEIITVRANPELPPIPLVKASVQITGDRETKAADRTVPRPFDPNDLKATLEASVWHSRAIQFKATSEVGLGFFVFKKNSNPAEDDPYSEEEMLAKYPWMAQANIDETFHEILIEMAMDRETIGDGWWEIEPDARGKIAAIYHVPGETMWLERALKGTAIVGYAQRILGNIKYFRRWGDTENLVGPNGKPRTGQMLRFKNPMIGNAWYGTPDWIAATRAIGLALASNDYNFQFFKNMAIPAWMITVTGSLSPETRENIIRFFRGNFNPLDGGAHRALLNEIDDDSVTIKLDKITADISEMSFEKLGNQTRDEIISANGVPPRVMGIAQAGKLGGGGDVREELNLFKEITVRPKQKGIESVINANLLENGDFIKFVEIDIEVDEGGDSTDNEDALGGGGDFDFEKQVVRFLKGMAQLSDSIEQAESIRDIEALLG